MTFRFDHMRERRPAAVLIWFFGPTNSSLRRYKSDGDSDLLEPETLNEPGLPPVRHEKHFIHACRLPQFCPGWLIHRIALCPRMWISRIWRLALSQAKVKDRKPLFGGSMPPRISNVLQTTQALPLDHSGRE